MPTARSDRDSVDLASLMHEIVRAIAHLTAPWQSLYSSSKAVSWFVTSLHLLGLLFAGGMAVSADRAVLRALRRGAEARRRLLDELEAVHGPVILALMVLVSSGVALALADVETFLRSPLFWTKMLLVSLLGLNGYRVMRAGSDLRIEAEKGALMAASSEKLWRRLRRAAGGSVVLWVVLVAIGAALVESA